MRGSRTSPDLCVELSVSLLEDKEGTEKSGPRAESLTSPRAGAPARPVDPGPDATQDCPDTTEHDDDSVEWLTELFLNDSLLSVDQDPLSERGPPRSAPGAAGSPVVEPFIISFSKGH